MATNDEIVNYYVGLLVIQYNNKPNARATIDLLARAAIMNQLPLQVQNAFNIDTAVGAQLDILGKYAGISRNNRTFSGLVTLSDDDYRPLLKLKLALNNAGSSLLDIQNIIHIFFSNSMRVFDYANMHMSYLVDSDDISLTIAEIFVRNMLLPKPMGVELGALIRVPNIDNLFGFRTYTVNTVNNSPFNSYDDYQLDRPWVSYANAVVM